MQAVTTREEREQGNPAPRYEKLADREPREEGGSALEPPAEGSHDEPSSPMSSPEEQHDERAR
jgi:hypothetical protein